MVKGGTEKCSHCGQDFTWTVVGDVWPGGKDREQIPCPACRTSAGAVMTSGTVRVERA
jgi:endogenous inhibitor of DNA gyrase (YacG/DUF329 family)